MARTVITRREAPAAIRERRPFKAASMSGRYTETADTWNYGRLPEEYREQWKQAVSLHAYAVWSYGTPILWILPSGEVVEPPVKYSMTTSHHIGYARRGAAA